MSSFRKSTERQISKDLAQVKPFSSTFFILVKVDSEEHRNFVSKKAKSWNWTEDEVTKEITQAIDIYRNQLLNVRKDGSFILMDIDKDYRSFIEVTVVDSTGNEISNMAEISNWEYTGGECVILSETYSSR